MSFWPCRFTVCAMFQFDVVNVNVSLFVKSLSLSGPSNSTGPVADNTTDTLADGRVASFTVYEPAPSSSSTVTADGDNTKPETSSSVNINIAEVAVAAGDPDTVPDTVTVSSSSSTLFEAGVNVKLSLPDEAPFAMVMLKPVTGMKPTLPATPEPVTVTATVRAASNRTDPPIVAVTATGVAPAPSATVAGATLNMISGTVSSSVTVTVTTRSDSAEYFESVVVDTA